MSHSLLLFLYQLRLLMVAAVVY